MISPTFEEFRVLAREHTVVPVWRDVVADQITPVAAFARLCRGTEPGFLLESVEHAERWSRWSFVGRRAAVTVRSSGRFVTVDRGRLPDGIRLDEGMLAALEDVLSVYRSPKIHDLPPLHGGLVGYLGYDVVREVEQLPNVPEDDRGFPDAVLSVIGDLAAFDHFRQRVTLISNAYVFDDPTDDELEALYDEATRRVEKLAADISRPLPEPLMEPPVPDEAPPSVTSTLPSASYQQAVEVAKEHILAGDIFQVVLSQRFDFPLEADPFDVYRVLRQVNPSPYMYFIRHPTVTLVGSSPEPMVQLLDGRVISRPIAGTRPRGRTEEEDRRLGAELQEHPKEMAEHVMLVDLARNDVGRVVSFGTEQVDEMMTLERYSHVMHLTSQVSGDLAPGLTPIDVLRATLPAGTVSGAPKVRAMEIIDELEPVKRGPYAGIVGYLDFSGNIDTAIAIRTMVVAENGHASVQAGAGIVADSDPELEDLECRNKAMALLGAVPTARRMASDRRLCVATMDVKQQAEDPMGLWKGSAVVPIEREVLMVYGPDAIDYVQGQLTQDIKAMAEDTPRYSFLLEPDGKVVALMRVVRRAGQVVTIDVDPGQGPAVRERLQRFLINVDCQISEVLPANMLAVRGPGTTKRPLPPPVPGTRVPAMWPGVEGFDDLDAGSAVTQMVTPAPREALEALRIEIGWPRSGVDIGPGDVPADAGPVVIDSAVSFTKGCYTGQELVERMDSRSARSPRPLRGLQMDGDAEVPPPGAEVLIGGEPGGVVTSSAWSSHREAPVALARMHRKIGPPAVAVVRWPEGQALARVIELPFR